MVQTNHFLDEYAGYNNSVEEWTDADGQRWMIDSKPRYRALERRLATLPRTVDEAIAKLKRPPVTTENTMQQMAFCPATGESRLLVRV